MLIALDAMGGDHAPAPIVMGAVQAAQELKDLHITLVGDRAQIEPLIPSELRGTQLDIFHCTQVIGMDESPVEGLRKKPDNSISRCWQLLAEKKVEAVVSAGNTGAMVAGGMRLRKYLKGIRRPGIGTIMPTAKGPCMIIDVGANVSPKPSHLLQYGAMGMIYAKYILKRENPTIGLINVGEEQGKGHDLAKDTQNLFKASPLKESFVGNIEGRDIHRGACDVIVTDGFVGNVILKLCEGVFEFIMKLVSKEVVATLPNDKMAAMQALQAMTMKYDYSTFGGAPLLGIDGTCIICHGSSKERAIKNALSVAATQSKVSLNQHIVELLDSLPAPASEEE
ncbi:phosphate acyltransferase PlsX [Telmatocola sphagniphila]|uniref:Phosphate acyltransferase n=1 Tax=Telmatocola sphagniphila TaxID=1123043 RepID=A0A8E6B7Q2_9BACT|nr:phosphate acyltransferase PlsX [Telmatocola sphagniphila]QVL33286.1 phosphate acyltransferase PlsX [Telmatocola sphagniphila]